MTDILLLILMALCAFLLGSIPFSYWLPRLFLRRDVCADSDDGNPGAANAFKKAGIPMGILCLVLDIAKGFVPVFLAVHFYGAERPLVAAVVFLPVLGHAVGIFRGFRGGKCISTSFGVLLGLIPRSFVVFLLAGLYIFFSIAVRIRPHARRSALVFGLFAIGGGIILILQHLPWIALGVVAVSMTVIYRHYRMAQTAEEAEAAKQPRE